MTTKFADDVNAWESHTNPAFAAARVQMSIDKIVSWNNKWRLILSTDKTKVICFTKNGHHDVSVHVKNKLLEQVTTKTCLGITFDENLTFSAHVDYACNKALKALNKISIFLSATDGLNTRNCVNLYKSLVRPHFEYAYPAWCSIKESDWYKLE